jgi:hypothetical protein
MKRGTMRMNVAEWEAQCAKVERWQVAPRPQPGPRQVNAGARAAVPDAPPPGAAPAPPMSAAGSPNRKAGPSITSLPAPAPLNAGARNREVGLGAAATLSVKPTPAPESAILAAVLTALRLHPRVAWAHRMNTGAYAVGDRYIRFGFPGLADIIGQTVSGAFLAVECKRVGKEPTDDQRAFLGLVAKSGGVSFVARSVDDVAAGLST